jgi:hypothetical protein
VAALLFEPVPDGECERAAEGGDGVAGGCADSDGVERWGDDVTTFGELFRAFPEQMADLCLDECFLARRPVYYFDEGAPLIEQRPMCEICGAVAVFHWRDDRYDVVHYSPPIPSLTQETCDDERCQASWEWITERGREGNMRRRAFRERFGVHWNLVPAETRPEAIAIAMLHWEAAHAIH